MPLPEPLPDLSALDLLVTVGELGSISAAASAHGVSQPAASMRLRSLERAFGLQLLERARSGSRLTAAGEATVEWAAAVLRDVRALLSGTTALRRAGTATLRVGASLTVAEYLLPDWLRRLATTLPATTVSLEMGNTARVDTLVGQGDVDVGFTEGPRPPRHLRTKDVREDHLMVVVGRDHRWAHRRQPLGPSHLATTPLLLREPGSGTRETLADALAAHGLGVKALMELASTTALKAAAISGTGPAVLSALAVAPEIRAGLLVAVPCDGLRLQRTIRAVWARARPLSQQAAHLVEIAASKDRSTH